MILRIKGLVKRFGDKIILNDLNYCFEGHGTVLVLGRNGSGKTSLLKLIAGLYKPTRGKIEIALSGTKLYFPESVQKGLIHYSVEELIWLFERFFDRNVNWSVYKYLVRDLDLMLTLENPRVKLKDLSAGQRRKLILSVSLSILIGSGGDNLFLIDEVFANIDVESSLKIIEFISTRLDTSNTVVLSTHVSYPFLGKLHLADSLILCNCRGYIVRSSDLYDLLSSKVVLTHKYIGRNDLPEYVIYARNLELGINKYLVKQEHLSDFIETFLGNNVLSIYDATVDELIEFSACESRPRSGVRKYV